MTLLTRPATCFLNGRSLGLVERGLRVHSVPSSPGQVRVRVVRDGEELISFTTPQAITDAPLRTARLTYSYSSACEREHGKLFD